MPLETILTIISTLFGGTGVVTFIAAKKERQAQAKITEAGALAAMSEVYERMIINTNIKIKEMQEEIDTLRRELDTQKMKCNNCLV